MNLFGLLRFITSHPLNRDAPLKAVGRFVRWQLASRLISAPVALPFVDDTRLLVERGMTGATGNWYSGLHEPDDMAFVLHALRPDDLFVDIGANVGSYTVLAAGVVGAHAISVEPLPATHARLQANVRLNGIEGLVETVCAGLSDAPGEIRFTSGLDTMNRVALPGENLPSVTVPVTTLDLLCGTRRPAVIKIDVEGHEMPVLGGGATVFASSDVQAVLMETNGSGERYGSSDDAIIARMREYGFTPCRYDWKSRAIEPAERGGQNTIFIRDVGAIQAKCRAAPARKLVNGSV
ncbi:MAG: FkbM family methyltransferase [Candidatus Andeanibacterium colombiense]|uniref:FkbM family methyltransferase n=1 Tax=Candidatus Andeanibacterium colombiense TaxID=3121345 RepID=A0AAJ5X7L3_9SPHN|nr:MAG: FkbM family methyltransferase [Sphingomonadaceae bacterium]